MTGEMSSDSGEKKNGGYKNIQQMEKIFAWRNVFGFWWKKNGGYKNI